MAVAVIAILAAVCVAAFVFISVTACMSPGGYEENTFMYWENVRSQNVQAISATALSLGSVFVIVLAAALVLLVCLFVSSSFRALGGG